MQKRDQFRITATIGQLHKKKTIHQRKSTSMEKLTRQGYRRVEAVF